MATDYDAPRKTEDEAGGTVGVHPGVGGMECVVAAPRSTYDEVLGLVRRCGFLAPS